jgi:uncharacterized protein (TIGR03382 family)
LLLPAVSQLAIAGFSTVPEIDSSASVSALALLGGALLVLRARRK